MSPPPPHILMITHPAKGHLLPLLDLAHHLTVHVSPITITLLLTSPTPLPPHIATCPSIHPLILPLPSNVSPSSTSTSSPSVASLIHSLSLLSPQILSWAHSIPNPPIALISDFFLGWTVDLARDLDVPRVNFSCCPALLLSVLDSSFSATSPPLPFRYDHLPSIYRRCKSNSGVPEWDFVAKSFRSNVNSFATVINSFSDLEQEFLDQIKRSYSNVLAVGPLLIRTANLHYCDSVTSWLDNAPAGSVIYICFGSQYSLDGVQARLLAAALEKCSARFLIAGGKFEMDTKDKGMVIEGWAPQREILGHGSVGAFVTHCGWNSVMEGMTEGKLMLTWPMEADQFVNERLVLGKGIGVRACVGGPGQVPEVDELAEVMRKAVGGGFAKERRNVEEMKRKAEIAVGEGGTSYGDLVKLISLLLHQNI